MARIGPKRLCVSQLNQREYKNPSIYDTATEVAPKTIGKKFNKYIEWVQPEIPPDASKRIVNTPINKISDWAMEEILGDTGKKNESFQWPQIAEQIASKRKAREEFRLYKGRAPERVLDENLKHALKRTTGVERLVSKETTERCSKRETFQSPVVSRISRTQIQQPARTSFESCASVEASRRGFEKTPNFGNSSSSKASIAASKGGDKMSTQTGVTLVQPKPLSLSSLFRLQNKSPLHDVRETARGTWPNIGLNLPTTSFTPYSYSSRPPATAPPQSTRRPTPWAIVPSTPKRRRFDYGLPCKSAGAEEPARWRQPRSAGRSARGSGGSGRRPGAGRGGGAVAVALHLPAKRWAVGPRPPGSSQRRPPPHPHMSCEDARYLRRALLFYGNCI